MKKLVRTSLNNVANKRGVRDLNIQLYSHDKNNAGFEFVIKNEVDLSEYKAKVLFDFQETFATWETKGIVEGNVVKVKFDTTFITKCEEVIGYLFLDSETDTLDVFKFKFNVVLSEIDKCDTAKRGFRYIKDQEVVDVITRSELEEEIKKLQVNGGIDLSNYLTTSVANEIFATKQELPSVSGLVTTEQLTTAKNSVVEEISNKGYVTSTVAEETYAKKSDLPTPYNDSALAERVTNLEEKVDKDTVYDDSDLKNRVQALENRPSTGGNVDEDIKNRVTVLEGKFVKGDGENIDLRKLVTGEELDYQFINRNSSAAIIQADKDIETYFLENTDQKDVDKIQVRGYVYSYAGETKIFKQKNGDDLEFVGFQGAMITLANVLPKDYDHYTFNDPEKRVTLLTDRNFKEVVPRDELKAIVKEILTELKSENN